VYSSLDVRKGLERAPVAGMAAALLVSLTACHGRHSDAVTIGQLAGMLESADPPHLYDANGSSTRREYGVIPGATLLPSSREYSLSLLPESKATPLIFYCASTWCGAAETAAKRAARAGYTRVATLPEGIKGWSEAGLPTEKTN